MVSLEYSLSPESKGGRAKLQEKHPRHQCHSGTQQWRCYFNKLNNFCTGQALMMSSGSAQPRRAWEMPKGM